MFGWIKEFKTFAVKGNVVDMAVGIIIGASFTKVVNSLVTDVIMPPIGVILGGVDFDDLSITLKEATGNQEAVTLNYGAFLTGVIDFLIVAFAVFLLVKGINKLRKEKKAEDKEVDCADCLMKIPRGARKCGHCGTPQ